MIKSHFSIGELAIFRKINACIIEGVHFSQYSTKYDLNISNKIINNIESIYLSKIEKDEKDYGYFESRFNLKDIAYSNEDGKLSKCIITEIHCFSNRIEYSVKFLKSSNIKSDIQEDDILNLPRFRNEKLNKIR
jgi:hypothetical protein